MTRPTRISPCMPAAAASPGRGWREKLHPGGGRAPVSSEVGGTQDLSDAKQIAAPGRGFRGLPPTISAAMGWGGGRRGTSAIQYRISAVRGKRHRVDAARFPLPVGERIKVRGSFHTSHWESFAASSKLSASLPLTPTLSPRGRGRGRRFTCLYSHPITGKTVLPSPFSIRHLLGHGFSPDSNDIEYPILRVEGPIRH